MISVRAQHGFTLIEVLVAMILMLVVFAATLSVLEVFGRQTVQSTTRNDTQDQARLATDRIVRQLRNVASSATPPTPIERAGPFDIVFQTSGAPSGQNTTGVQRVRFCVPPDTASGDPADEALIVQTQTWTTAAIPANPWPAGSSIDCPDANVSKTTAGGTVTYGAAITLASHVTNRYRGTSRALFTFDAAASAPADLTSIDTVGVDLFVNTTPSSSSRERELQTAALLRNQDHPPQALFVSSAPGGGHIQLNALDPSGESVTYSWTCTSSNCSTDSIPPGQFVDWKPKAGPGTYSVALTVTDANGLSFPGAPQQVVVR